jgi:ATP-dependent protease HslVU (ClpYQ) peptidase subunit
MTTLAFDGKMMAGDTRWCANGVHVISRTKIQRLSSGGLYGAAGSSDDRELIALLAKVKRPQQLPTLAQLGAIRQDLQALLILPSSRAYVIDTCHINQGAPEASECGVTEYDAPCAIGTGGELALAAMRAQIAAQSEPDAFAAVQIACDLDPWSKRPVTRLTLDPKQPQRK